MKKSCLIIEQNRDALEIFSAAFDLAGFSVWTARDSDEAAAFLGRFCPSLVFLDQWTIAHFGTADISQVLDQERFAKTRVVRVTSAPVGLPEFSSPEDLILVKPVPFAELREIP
jgi:DNA-binding response OmpR family regulator